MDGPRGWATEWRQHDLLALTRRCRGQLDEEAVKIQFNYREDVYGDGGYYVSYYYDDKTNTYTRYVNGSKQKDEPAEKRFSFRILLCNYAYHEVLDDEGKALYEPVFWWGRLYL